MIRTAKRALAWANFEPPEIRLLVRQWITEAGASLTESVVDELTIGAILRRTPLATFKNWTFHRGKEAWTLADLLRFSRARRP
jgi:hypothetical protein